MSVAATTEFVAPPRGGRVYSRGVSPGFADTAPSGRIRLDAVARWLQDVAYADVIDAGTERAAVWVVRRSRIAVSELPAVRGAVSAGDVLQRAGADVGRAPHEA